MERRAELDAHNVRRMALSRDQLKAAVALEEALRDAGGGASLLHGLLVRIRKARAWGWQGPGGCTAVLLVVAPPLAAGAKRLAALLQMPTVHRTQGSYALRPIEALRPDGCLALGHEPSLRPLPAHVSGADPGTERGAPTDAEVSELAALLRGAGELPWTAGQVASLHWRRSVALEWPQRIARCGRGLHSRAACSRAHLALLALHRPCFCPCTPLPHAASPRQPGQRCWPRWSVTRHCTLRCCRTCTQRRPALLLRCSQPQRHHLLPRAPQPPPQRRRSAHKQRRPSGRRRQCSHRRRRSSSRRLRSQR